MIRSFPYSLITLLITGSLILSSCTAGDSGKISPEQKKDIRYVASDYMKNMQGVLLSSVHKYGIEKAAAVCSDTAMKLTANYGGARGIYINRVSLKYRNPADAPDKFEKKILLEFQAMLDKGELNRESDYFEMTKEAGRNVIRYMRPLFTGGLCLSCHGDQKKLLPGIKTLLERKYPGDKAVDYKEGELRGAVSIKKFI